MCTIINGFNIQYDVGDVVIFEKNGNLQVGIVEGFYIDDDIFWFNIRVSQRLVYTYSNGGDIGEHNIIGKVEDKVKDKCIRHIKMIV
jgi:hypothetical protein